MSIYQNFDGEFLNNTRPKFRRKKFYDVNKDSLNELMKIVYWAKDYKEAMRCFDCDIQEPPKCYNCGEHPGFVSNASGYPYRKFCLKEECQYKRNRQSHTPEAREKYNKTCMDRHGYTNPFKSREWQEQNRQNLYNEYGVYNCMQLEEVKDKQRNTLIERYGVDHIWKSEDIKNSRKETWLKKYGADNPSKSEVIKDKIRFKWFERYNETPDAFQDFRDKVKKTYIDKWGVEHYLQCEEGVTHWRSKFAESHNGVDHPMHVPEIASKQGSTSGGFKEYTSSKGNTYRLQGYEHYAIEILEDLDVYFINERSDIGNIPYVMDGINRRYYPDIYLPEEDIYIEVKSRYTYEGDSYKLQCIMDSNPSLNLIIIIFNNNGSIDEII